MKRILFVLGAILCGLAITYWASAQTFSLYQDGRLVWQGVCSSTPTPPPIPPNPPPQPPPPGPTPTGQWVHDAYGWSIYGIGIPKGQTVIIEFSPKALGALLDPVFSIVVLDNYHKNTAATFVDVLELSADGKLLKTWRTTQGGQDDWPFIIKNWSAEKLAAGVKFQIRLVEQGVGSTSVNVKID